MKYQVTREGPLEIHRVELHAVEQAQAATDLKPEVYNALIAQEAIAPRLFALAMMANVIESQGKPKPPLADDSRN